MSDETPHGDDPFSFGSPQSYCVLLLVAEGLVPKDKGSVCNTIRMKPRSSHTVYFLLVVGCWVAVTLTVLMLVYCSR